MEDCFEDHGGKRTQSVGEEIANSVSHGVGLVAALIASPFLILVAAHKDEPLSVVAVCIFATSMILLYLSSMLYHCLPRRPAKRMFALFDHIAIFLLIAGTYTPFALGVLRGTLGWTLFGLIWGAALIGIITKVVPQFRHPKLSLALYLGMGWMILPVIQPLYQHLQFNGMLWLVGGGLAYTIGVIFYVAKAKYSHFIWHLFTIAGTTCHFFAVLWYAI